MTWGLVGVGVDGGAEPWEAAGFTVADAAVPLGNGAVLLGRTGLVVHASDRSGAAQVPSALDGIALAVADRPLAPADHPNGAIALDHVVVMTDSLERTSTAVEEALGLPCRRVRETDHVRQAFHRFADAVDARGCIVEVVESTRAANSSIWGIVVIVEDLAATCARLGPEVIGAPKPAVQPGRLIATVRREAGLPTAVALMSA